MVLSVLQPRWLSTVFLFVLMCGTAYGADTETELLSFVESNTRRLEQRLQDERVAFEQDRELFFNAVNEEMAELVDFPRVAGRVMGKYRKTATNQEKADFLEAFKRSLFSAYANLLLDNSDKIDIEVLSAEINTRNARRAVVELIVTSPSGDRYPVTYAMFVNSEGRWQLENIIVDGLNVGLLYRDQFSDLAKTHRGDIGLVIANWTAEIESTESEN